MIYKTRAEEQEQKESGDMKTLGVIGGLGPMATAFFMQMVIEMTEARTDQQHIEMLIHNCPSIPDRTNYILGKRTKNMVRGTIFKILLSKQLSLPLCHVLFRVP